MNYHNINSSFYRFYICCISVVTGSTCHLCSPIQSISGRLKFFPSPTITHSVETVSYYIKQLLVGMVLIIVVVMRTPALDIRTLNKWRRQSLTWPFCSSPSEVPVAGSVPPTAPDTGSDTADQGQQEMR